MKKAGNRTIKSLARQMFKGYYLQAFLVVLAMNVFLNVPGMIISTFFPQSYFANLLLIAYRYIFAGPLLFACAIFFLCNFREQRVGFNSLMYGFDFFSKSSAVFLSVAVRVVLGCFLFIIPGLIAAAKYSQALFILVDDPAKSPGQCLAESAKMMEGNKLNLVSLILSYAVFFVIFVAMPVFIAANSLPPVTYTDLMLDPDIVNEMAQTLNSSPWVYLSRFTNLINCTRLFTGLAAFYDIYSGNLIFRDGPAAEEGQTENDETLQCN